MNETTNKFVWAAGSIAVMLIIASMLFVFKGQMTTHFGAPASGANVSNSQGILSIASVLNPGNGNIMATGTVEVPQLSMYSASADVNIQAPRLALTSATSTPCAIQNPFNATSSILNFVDNITAATTSIIVYAIGTSTTQYATSTSIISFTVPSGTPATISWDGGVNNNVIGPLQWIVVGSGAGTTLATGAFGTGIVTAGSCTATFITDN